MSIALDYVERTGLHLRVGLVDDDGILEPVDRNLEQEARDLVSGLGTCWDVSATSATTVELSFEEDPEP